MDVSCGHENVYPRSRLHNRFEQDMQGWAGMGLFFECEEQAIAIRA